MVTRETLTDLNIALSRWASSMEAARQTLIGSSVYPEVSEKLRTLVYACRDAADAAKRLQPNVATVEELTFDPPDTVFDGAVEGAETHTVGSQVLPNFLMDD